jgi:glycosyltransferase involved in cell wall biosynthesis
MNKPGSSKTKAPLVSIVTCTYNRAHLIGETIQTVLSQTFQDFEYIIVDDGSEDNTLEIVEGFNDSRITYFKLPHTKGNLSKLKNFGIAKSNGRYIAFVDSDDLWLPEKLKLQIEPLERNPLLHFSFTDVELFNAQGVIKNSTFNRSGIYEGRIFDDFIRNKFIICATTLVFRKSCWSDLGGLDESLTAGDFDFIVALSAQYKAFAIYEPMVRVRKHNHNTTQRLVKSEALGYLVPLQKLIDKKLVDPKIVNRTRSNFCYSFGVEFGQQKEYSNALGFFIKSIAFSPWQWKSYVRFLVTSTQKIIGF